MLQKLTRGVRNNNPANIRRSSSHWLGLAAAGSLAVPYDKEFCQFVSVEYGVRAFLCLLRTYINKYNVLSIVQFVHRFAPSGDGNDEYAYCSHICKFLNIRTGLGINRNDKLFESDCFDFKPSNFPDIENDLLFEFCRAVFLVESNYELSPFYFRRAYKMI